jgi:hypothetical protein
VNVVETFGRFSKGPAPLTEAQKAQAQRALELVRLRLNINRVPVGMKEINQNGHLWRNK